MTIKLVTLKTDKTLLATIAEDSSMPGAILLKEPVQVIIIPPRSQTDSGGMGFLPFLDYCEEFKTGIVISPNDILTITTPQRELLNQYNTMFGSGIQIASSLK
jgi:hypothetical protein